MKIALFGSALCLLAMVAGSSAWAVDADRSGEILSQIAIESPTFEFLPMNPKVHFTVANKSAVAIKTIYVLLKLQSPGRSVPWAENIEGFQISGGIEPGETKRMDSLLLSPWTGVSKDDAKQAALTAVVKGIEDASGKRIGE
jgi:hypothetical protein